MRGRPMIVHDRVPDVERTGYGSGDGSGSGDGWKVLTVFK